MEVEVAGFPTSHIRRLVIVWESRPAGASGGPGGSREPSRCSHSEVSAERPLPLQPQPLLGRFDLLKTFCKWSYFVLLVSAFLGRPPFLENACLETFLFAETFPKSFSKLPRTSKLTEKVANLAGP